MREVPQPTTGVEGTVARLAALYEVAGPRIGCLLVEANIILVFADLRGQTDTPLYEPAPADEETIAHLQPLLATWGMHWMLATPLDHPNGRPYRGLIFESLAGYAYISKRTSMHRTAPFETSGGWDGLEVWNKTFLEGLRTHYEDHPILLDRWIGLVYGYPDCAVEDACRTLREGRSFDHLAHYLAPSAARYGGAQPGFSCAPEHANDPDLLATQTTWEALLQGVYVSNWHQQLAQDAAFQEARQKRRGES